MRILNHEQEERFWSHVDWSDDLDACWEWNAYRDGKGYGRVQYAGCPDRLAHRVAYKLLVGDIPEGMTLDHECENTSCANPCHVSVKTSLDNYMLSSKIGLATCKHGHQLTPDNVYVYPSNGRRECRTCAREYKRAYKKRVAYA